MSRTTLALSAAVAVLGVLPFAADAAKPPNSPPGKLTLVATPNPVKFGRSVTLSGKLTGPNNSGKVVDIFADPFPYDTFTKVTSSTTNASGGYSTARKPGVNTRYQARQGADQSTIVTVLVRPAVSLRLSDYTPRRGQRVRFRGRVCPQHDGSSLSIQRHYRTGYRTLRKTTLRDILGSTCSSYRKTIRIFRDGRFRAVIGAHSDHTRGLSTSRVARVH